MEAGSQTDAPRAIQEACRIDPLFAAKWNDPQVLVPDVPFMIEWAVEILEDESDYDWL